MNDERGVIRRLFIVHCLSFIVLLAACASAPPPPTPTFTEVPRSVLDVFCSRIHDEGISVETTVDVVKTTQPLITPESMASLADAVGYSKPFDPIVASQKANHDASP